MKVAKWGNSLAVRLPLVIVEALQLKEGDEVEIHLRGDREFGIDRDNRRLRALERLRALQVDFPPDFKFDRDEANAR